MLLPFAARSRLRWPGLSHDERGNPHYHPPTERGRELLARYSLARYQGAWSRGTWRTVIGTLDVLDRVPMRFSPGSESPRVLDVGCSHWRYFGALSAWLRERGAPEARVTGVELDAFRLYRNLRTPASLARYHSATAREALREVRYVEGDVRGLEGQAELVTWLFPFLFEDTVRAWGLPRGVLRPAELARAVFARLAPGGRCLIVNQGEDEWRALRGAFAEGAPEARCEWHSREERTLHAAAHPLFVSLWFL